MYCCVCTGNDHQSRAGSRSLPLVDIGFETSSTNKLTACASFSTAALGILQPALSTSQNKIYTVRLPKSNPARLFSNQSSIAQVTPSPLRMPTRKPSLVYIVPRSQINIPAIVRHPAPPRFLVGRLQIQNPSLRIKERASPSTII
jgi:hypothetical protein